MSHARGSQRRLTFAGPGSLQRKSVGNIWVAAGYTACMLFVWLLAASSYPPGDVAQSVKVDSDKSAAFVRPRQAKLRALSDVTWSLAKNRPFRSRDRRRLLHPREDDRNLQGHVAVVTGGSSGIGRSVAAGLVARGAKVILGCRNATKAEEARNIILEGVGTAHRGDVVSYPLDLDSLSSTAQFAKEIQANHPDVSILINNAGVGGGGEGGITKDGIELNFGVNFLSHYLLTMLLLPNLLENGVASQRTSAIINLSSVVHWLADSSGISHLDSTLWRPTNRTIDGGEYKRSKLFMLMLSRELNRRLTEIGRTHHLAAFAVNPGAVDSEIWRYAPTKYQWQVRNVYPKLFKTCEQGALSVLACLNPDVKPGSYLADETPSAYSQLADDRGLNQWLWRTSSNATGLDLDVVATM
mmetsp:Transcript_35958/g.69480  ORF Transcript_35958/g.69480 Transcript_35958/m.69480 type:complete len:412 (-) Transcript_35958:22-1257(-)